MSIEVLMYFIFIKACKKKYYKLNYVIFFAGKQNYKVQKSSLFSINCKTLFLSNFVLFLHN